jgi:hypothetical protein
MEKCYWCGAETDKTGCRLDEVGNLLKVPECKNCNNEDLQKLKLIRNEAR